MNSELQELQPKVENEGTTPQGKLSAAEWNILLTAVKILDERVGESDIDGILKVVRDAGYATQEWVNEVVKGSINLDGYISVSTNQDIEGLKNFINGIRIGGSLITYDPDTQSFILDGNLIISGEVAMRAMLGDLDVPTIMNALKTDNENLKVIDGVLTFVGKTGEGGGSGIDYDQLKQYLDGQGYVTENDNIKTATTLATPRSLWGRVFDGSQDLTGSLNVTTGEGYRITYNGYDLRFIVSGSTSNRGIWDGTNNSWMLYRSNNKDVKIPEGNVIIGEATSTAKLNVGGDMNVNGAAIINHSGNTPLVINQSYATNNSRGVVLMNSSMGNGHTFFSHLFGKAASMYNSAYVGYYHAGAGSTQNYLSMGMYGVNNILNITGDGNVGIGTTNPLAKCHIKGELYVQNEGVHRIGNRAFYAYNSTANGGYVIYDALADGESCRFEILDGSGGWVGNGWTLYKNGNMGIGTTAPSEKLHVNGNILASGGITARSTSDKRLKKNFEDINATEMLMSLGKVQSFEYVDSEVEANPIYKGKHIGLVYQNVKGSALDKMCQEREDGYGALNYLDTSFISLLAGVCQEQAEMIKELKREVEQLKEKVDLLERRG